MKNKKETLRYAFKSSLPIFAGYVVLGIGFGVLLQSKGYSWWWALLMSVTIFSGSLQYVAVDLLSSGAGLISCALVTLMVNIRYAFYSITMLEKYKNTGKAKPYLIFSLTDETYSLVVSPSLPENVDENGYRLFLSLLDQSYWILGSVLGAVAGDIIPFNTKGIDFAMTALFVVIFVQQWESTKKHICAITGIVVTALCLVVFGSENFLVPSVIFICVALIIERKWIKDDMKVSPEKEALPNQNVEKTSLEKTNNEQGGFDND